MIRAVFLDRDGVLNHAIERGGKAYSPRSLQEFKLVHGIETSIRRLRTAGYLAIVVTNQPDLSRGLLSESVHSQMMAELTQKVELDDVLVCPDDSDAESFDKKPNPGMLLRAAEQHSIDLGHSFIVGDTWKDVEAGRRAACTPILIDRPYNRDDEAPIRVRDLAAAVDYILSHA